ncbi:MAG: PcfJ domain-containing protein [Pseudomonadota bacterium]
MTDGKQAQLRAARDPETDIETLDALAASTDTCVLTALIANPYTPTETLRRLSRSPRIGVRKALLDSPRCPLVSSVAEDRLAFEGIDIALFVDQHSRRDVCRALIGTGHRAETTLVFSDPTLRVLDCLRTLHSLFTIHGGKKRDRKLNRHDYLRFLADFNERGGRYEVLDLPVITLLTSIRLLGQERLVRVMTEETPDRAMRTLRLLEAVAGSQAGEEGEHQQALLGRWLERHEDWPARMHDYLDRKYRRRASRRRNRAPQTLSQSRFGKDIREFNRSCMSDGIRVHLPRTERELQALGATMANCIGSEHNVQDAVDGRHVILHVHPLRTRRKGVTCQFDARGKLLQARGFANGEADESLVEWARRAIETLATGPDTSTESHS